MSDHENKKLSEKQKWMVSVYSAILFFIISAPFMYKLTGAIFSYFGLNIQMYGCPNYLGLVIHAVVFALLIRLLMLVPVPGG